MNIEKRLRNFSLWLRSYGVYIALTVIILSFGGIFLLLTSSISRQAETAAQNKEILTEIQKVTSQLSTNGAATSEQIGGIGRHLDCIVSFFAQEDRINKSIADIEQCVLEDGDTGAQTSTPSNKTPASQTPASDTQKQSSIVTDTPPKADPRPAPSGVVLCNDPKTLLFITIKVNC